MKINTIKLDTKKFRATIEESAGLVAIAPARKLANNIVKEKREEFLHEFITHEISEEILAGPETNSGVGGENGNLYSFLGFASGSDPVQDLYTYFSQNIKLNPRHSYNKSSKTIIFKMDYPSIDEIKEASDLGDYTDEEWGSGRSWAISIERGIPGLAHYKYSLDSKKLKGDSRSGTALQRKNVIHPGAVYKPQKYITTLLKILDKI